MFNIGIFELLVIGIIALLVIGPERLPLFARQMIRILNEFKRAAEEVEDSITEIKKTGVQEAEEIKKSLSSKKDHG